ncbi:hypothetical protein HDU96_006218 [Phlyctochytrium bullatum]|nr:hypothetical protein HDU96_006218 [Phlyctochytrium bullatum]
MYLRGGAPGDAVAVNAPSSTATANTFTPSASASTPSNTGAPGRGGTNAAAPGTGLGTGTGPFGLFELAEAALQHQELRVPPGPGPSGNNPQEATPSGQHPGAGLQPNTEATMASTHKPNATVPPSTSLIPIAPATATPDKHHPQPPTSETTPAPTAVVVAPAKRQTPKPGRTRGPGGPRCCQFCIRRKLRCVVRDDNNPACSSCEDRGMACSFLLKDGDEEAAGAATSAPGVGGAGAAGRKKKRKQSEGAEAEKMSPGATVEKRQKWTSPGASGPSSTTDDLPPPDVRNLLFMSSFQMPQTILPIFHRASLLTARPPRYLALALESLAAVFARMTSEAERLQTTAVREVLVALAETPGADADALVPMLQAVVALVGVSLLLGKAERDGTERRWLGMAVVAARQCGLGEEVVNVDALVREVRRRLWWSYVATDLFLAVAHNTPPLISPTEQLHLRVLGPEGLWNRGIPPEASDLLPWSEVLDALETPDPRFPPAPALRDYWTRVLAALHLQREALVLSSRVWRAGLPTLRAPPLSLFDTQVRAVLDAGARFHEVGGTGPNGAGEFRSGEFDRILGLAAAMLVYAPRSVVDAVFARDPGDLAAAPTGGVLGDPVLEAWMGSEIAQACRWHLDECVGMWRGVLEEEMATDPAKEEEGEPPHPPHHPAYPANAPLTPPSTVPEPSGSSAAPLKPIDAGGGPKTKRFFDRTLAGLGAYQFYLVYAGQLQTLFDAWDAAGVPGPQAADASQFGVLARAVDGMASMFRGLPKHWRRVEATRKALFERVARWRTGPPPSRMQEPFVGAPRPGFGRGEVPPGQSYEHKFFRPPPPQDMEFGAPPPPPLAPQQQPQVYPGAPAYLSNDRGPGAPHLAGGPSAPPMHPGMTVGPHHPHHHAHHPSPYGPPDVRGPPPGSKGYPGAPSRDSWDAYAWGSGGGGAYPPHHPDASRYAHPPYGAGYGGEYGGGGY